MTSRLRRGGGPLALATVCVGETEAERKGGKTLDVVGTQVLGSLPVGLTASTAAVAYEAARPRIGTGLFRRREVTSRKSTASSARSWSGFRWGRRRKPACILTVKFRPLPERHELLSVADANGALVAALQAQGAADSVIASAYL